MHSKTVAAAAVVSRMHFSWNSAKLCLFRCLRPQINSNRSQPATIIGSTAENGPDVGGKRGTYFLPFFVLRKSCRNKVLSIVNYGGFRRGGISDSGGGWSWPSNAAANMERSTKVSAGIERFKGMWHIIQFLTLNEEFEVCCLKHNILYIFQWKRLTRLLLL